VGSPSLLSRAHTLPCLQSVSGLTCAVWYILELISFSPLQDAKEWMQEETEERSDSPSDQPRVWGCLDSAQGTPQSLSPSQDEVLNDVTTWHQIDGWT
jgi:hypothetical protein